MKKNREFSSFNNKSNLEGVVCITFTLCFKHNEFNKIGLFCSASLASIIQEPTHKGNKDSNTKMSKHIVVTETIFLFLKGITSQVPKIKFVTFTCFTITPLGFPVEPEV